MMVCLLVILILRFEILLELFKADITFGFIVAVGILGGGIC
jgi:hypothetical protein